MTIVEKEKYLPSFIASKTAALPLELARVRFFLCAKSF